MSLFTDSGLIGISDLSIYEVTLSKTASTHGINVESKTTLAMASIGDRLLARLMHAGASTGGFLSSVSLSSIRTLPPQSAWSFNLNNVVVTDQLKRWICYEVLAQCFAEAYNVQLNDRYREKWLDYASRAKTTEQSLYEIGIGIVYQPLSQPGNALVTTGSGSLTGGIVTVQTVWQDASGHESILSPLVPVTLADQSSMTVTTQAGNNHVPATAIGWNVYVGANGSSPSKQNATPVALNASWTAPAAGFVTGAAPRGGQQPEAYLLDSQRLVRG
jgi:hypothetical protein